MKMYKREVFFFLIAFGCAIGMVNSQAPPDYAKMEYWAAHPDKTDAADRIPGDSLLNMQRTSDTDVFFLHPTTYTKGKPKSGKRKWNGSVQDEDLNTKTEESTILHQASIFNGVGKVYAPFYRQAHLHTYHTKDKKAAKKAFDLAYQDIKMAFEYFLKYENEGRPIIIAAHSQGTTHGKRLLKDFFDTDTELRARLVAAYIVGIPVLKNEFDNIPVCESPGQIGCFCTWRTFKEGHYPKNRALGDSIAVVNPLSWNTSGEKVDKSRNKGSVLAKFEKGTVANVVGAQINNGILWVEKPKFPGSFLLTTKNYHIADFNFFYLSVRENSIYRVEQFNQKHNLK